MEEVGTQVVSPMFINHQALASGVRFCEPHPMAKKRSLPPFQPSIFQQQQDSWNPKLWEWDSVRFVAKPMESDALRASDQMEAQGRVDESRKVNSLRNSNPAVGEDDESLRLRLGGSSANSAEQPAARPQKRVRSGSPNGGGNYPMCQVDNCKEDLSNAKDYHRRHKVCEVHSKASKALVGKQMQRFCQQCSRFHPLSAFDEGKRSCRRRLAGHNRRRRKTQPDDVTSPLLLHGNQDGVTKGDLDLVNLLAVLARAQEDGGSTVSSVLNTDQLVQIFSKINSLPLPTDFAAKLPPSTSFSKHAPNQVSCENLNRLKQNSSSPSTMDLLAVLSASLASPPSDNTAVLSQSSQASEIEKSKLASPERATCLNLQKGTTLEYASNGGERSSTSYQSPIEDSDCQVPETHSNLPLQLFSCSPENDSRPKLSASRKYCSSDSSNPMDERSPSSSPVVQKLFPMQTSRETLKPESLSSSGELNAKVEASRPPGCITSLELFGRPNRVADNSSFLSFPYQAGYTSSSGSDHSPSSLNSDAQDRTGRIIFKLFDKDPSHLQGTLRQEIFNWLSRSPSEMESYIRPGCVILSIYISMPYLAWEKLEENFLQHVYSLVENSETDLWTNTRFLVKTDKQLASHKDGRIRLSKYCRAWNSPELISVSPLAVVGGQETSLFLRGRNLSTCSTKIHCTYVGGYILQDVSGSASQEAMYDEINLKRFMIYGEAPGSLGRCFIEVENGFSSTSFPVIIADAIICQELKVLESEVDCGLDGNVHDLGRPQSREEVLHFLNELGWLFQRNKTSHVLEFADFTLGRFRFLLMFSVERDFCAVVKKLLEMLQERALPSKELSRESLEMLKEINLLSRAVKRRCRNMVDLLLHYSIFGDDDSSRKYIFLPNLVGPAGITPLHLAASASGADDMVDTLTSDPQEVGLRGWNSLLDANGLSPFAYAMMRNNHSYNKLVAQKLADRRKDEVSIPIGDKTEQRWFEVDQDQSCLSQMKRGQKSCSKCAAVAARCNKRMSGTPGLLSRPYIHSMLAIAAVCVCVCLFLRGSPQIGLVEPFKWENLDFGSI